MLRRDRTIQLIPIALAVFLSLAAVWWVGPHSIDVTDADDYLAAARFISDNGVYLRTSGELPMFRPPLYPLLIAGVWAVFPGSILAIKVLQVAFFALTAWLIFRIGMLVTGDRLMSLAASVIFAVNPIFLVASASILSECLQFLLITAALYLFVSILKGERAGTGRYVSMGLILGLASLNKPSAFGIALVLVALLVVFKFRHGLDFLKSGFVVAGLFAAILPWSFYNLKTTGEFILLTDGGGYNLWGGSLTETIPIFEGSFENNQVAQDDFKTLVGDLAKRRIAEWESTVGYSALSIKQRENLWFWAGVENVTANPALTARLFGWKIVNFWKPYLSSEFYSPTLSLLSALFLVPFFAVGLYGLRRMWADSENFQVALAGVVIFVAAMFIHLAFVSSIRHRLPYVDLPMTIFAGVGVGVLLSRRRIAEMVEAIFQKKIRVREVGAGI
ncbi:MAG: glycosyltransferase family 39 protein [Pyrinomonadaceae bacterium]